MLISICCKINCLTILQLLILKLYFIFFIAKHLHNQPLPINSASHFILDPSHLRAFETLLMRKGQYLKHEYRQMMQPEVKYIIASANFHGISDFTQITI